MPTIELVTTIAAPVDICFDLARDIDLHLLSTPGTKEQAVAGVITGLINLGESVTWEATHFGVRQRLTSQITSFNRPGYFRDSQIAGPFRRFDHDHFFTGDAQTTVMRDVFDYQSPLGWIGLLADKWFLCAYLHKLLRKRADVIRTAAEACTRTEG